MWEFAEGLRLLEGCSEFASVVPRSDVEISALWQAGVDFFQSNERLIKQVRNDIGGHFGTEAAKYAVENLGPTATGKIEMVHHPQKPGRPEFRLNFAGELAASAFVRHLPGATVEEQVETFMQAILVRGLSACHQFRARAGNVASLAPVRTLVTLTPRKTSPSGTPISRLR